MRKAVKASFDGRESKGKSTRGNGATAVTRGSRLRRKKRRREKNLRVFKQRPSPGSTSHHSNQYHLL